VCFHDTIAEDHPELVFPDRAGRWAWRAKTRLALWQATRVMTISEASRQSLASRYGLSPDRIDLVTEGPSPLFLAEPTPEAVRATLVRLGLPGDRPLLLHVGGMSPHKNLTRLLEAAALVLPRRAACLVLVGDPEADGFHDNAAELRSRIAADARLRADVRFTGYVSDPDLAHLYRGARALVFPSLAEGFGLPAVEAMACGLPVLASRAGSLPEVVGDAGLLFDPHDPRAIAESIERILADDELRAELSRRARERVRLFTWQRAADLALASLRKAAG
jgi:glycosyltransferase involved in cell wall biosynthesis